MDSQEIGETAAERAALGLAWLREHGPEHGFDWTRIDADLLDVADNFNCALTQASTVPAYSAPFSTALRRAVEGVCSPWPADELDEEEYRAATTRWFDESDVWARAHGFLIDQDVDTLTYADLTQAWREALAMAHSA
jgi:hypothetical protein